MAENVLGRSIASPYSPARPHRDLHRTAGQITSRRYRAAYRRAERYAYLLRLMRSIVMLPQALRAALWPFSALMGAIAYAGAGVGVALRDWQTGLAAHRAAALELITSPAYRKKRSHIRLNTALAFIAVGIASFTLSMYQVGLEVIVDGVSIGFVSNQSVVEDSLESVSQRASEILGSPYIVPAAVKYQFSLVNKNRVFNREEFEESMLSSIPEIENLYVLRIEDEVVGAARSQATLNGVLNSILEEYPCPEDIDVIGFVQNYSISSQLTSTKILRTADEIRAILTSNIRDEVWYQASAGETAESVAQEHGLTIETLHTLNPQITDWEADSQNFLIQKAKPYVSVSYQRHVARTEPIPYETEYIDDPSLWAGQKKVVTPGVAGEMLIIEVETTVDGYAPVVEKKDGFALTEPVTEVIANGTRTRNVTGTYIKPYNGIISSNYGPRKIFGQYEFHKGIDFKGPKGAQIVASDGGVVSFTGSKGTYGLLVVITHSNGYSTAYAHCSKILVKQGQRVGQGEVIALIGTTGRSTGPHVHFEVRINGVQKNPNNYLKK